MIRALLVDDEAPARDRMRGLLADHDDVEIVGEARDGDEALRLVAEARPDLVFLDIEMPGLTGLEVAMALPPPRPRIVYCTAYDHYAIEAFEHQASDYLLKPVSRRRLVSTLDRLRRAIGEERTDRRERSVAEATQARLLAPAGRALPGHGRIEFAGRCLPLGGVGGDYYDLLPLDGDRVALALGDVAGKGLFAGLLMAGLQARVQSLAPGFGTRVGELVAEIDRALGSTTDDERYATLFYGVHDPEAGRLDYVNAGHPPPLLLRHGSNAAPERLHANSPVVGLLGAARFETSSTPLGPGDLLAMYSDGVTEWRDRGGRELGVEGLERALGACVAQHPGLAVGELTDRLLERLRRRADGHPPDDDLTLALVRVGGAPG